MHASRVSDIYIVHETLPSAQSAQFYVQSLVLKNYKVLYYFVGKNTIALMSTKEFAYESGIIHI